ncbi:MAG: cell division control protein Cdc6 [Thermoprotei archaeon]|nr:MAG: cell division control protein Cdc6 [Thermoprotei archaeon]
MPISEMPPEGSKIFKDEGKLQPEYIPKKLPHRKQQLIDLGEYFKNYILKPGSMFVKVVLVGGVGTGKTAVAKTFGSKIEEFSSKRTKHKIRYVHINCHAYRTLFALMRRLALDIGIEVPRRGFSREEILYLIWNHLRGFNKYMVVTVDEADYLIKSSGSEALYDLTRINEIVGDDVYRMGMIFVFRDTTSLFQLSRSIRSTLSGNLIRFDPYTSDQLFDILWSRIRDEGAMYEEAVPEDVIGSIAELVGHDKGGTGDARLALEILWKSGKRAEREGRDIITLEDVREANKEVTQPFSADIVKNLTLHEKLLMLALVRLLKKKKYINKVPLGMLELEYNELCNEYGIEPRKHTRVWDYVQSLNSMGLIMAERSGKGYRGRTTLVSIPSAPLSTLEKILMHLIKEISS